MEKAQVLRTLQNGTKAGRGRARYSCGSGNIIMRLFSKNPGESLTAAGNLRSDFSTHLVPLQFLFLYSIILASIRASEDGELRTKTKQGPIRTLSRILQVLEFKQFEFFFDLGHLTSCHRIFANPEGTFVSPNFPNDYPLAQSCVYDIARSRDGICGIRLTCNLYASPLLTRWARSINSDIIFFCSWVLWAGVSWPIWWILQEGLARNWFLRAGRGRSILWEPNRRNMWGILGLK